MKQMKYPLLALIMMFFAIDPSFAQKSVTIGGQTWSMNLNTKEFRNGDPIPQAQSDAAWKAAAENGTPAWSYINNDPSTAEQYGLLYNWYAVNDSRGLAPAGWRVATQADWKALADQYPNQSADALKTKEGWSRGLYGNNSSGFSGYPVGIRGVPKFLWEGQMTIFWTSDENDAESAFSAALDYNYKHIVLANQFKVMGLSVRCVKN